MPDGLDKLLLEYGIPESDIPAMREAVLTGKSPIASEVLSQSAANASTIAQRDMAKLTELAHLIANPDSSPRVYNKKVTERGRELIRDEAAQHAAGKVAGVIGVMGNEEHRMANMEDYANDLAVRGNALTSNFAQPGTFEGLQPLPEGVRRTVGEAPESEIAMLERLAAGSQPIEIPVEPALQNEQPHANQAVAQHRLRRALAMRNAIFARGM